ncbi:MAG TPA: molybdate ABC transporter permease subunit [Nitrospinota bacterium]|nr:molybdate ABC transporter permease subunit [Nitrospinota bacterium]
MELFQSPLWITIKLATISTFILLLISTPMAWWLSRDKGKFKAVVESVVAIPLVLPPTVLGFYLLIALSPNGFLGAPLEALGIGSLAFTFEGLLIGSIIYSLAFVVRPLQNSFESVNDELLEAAATLGASPLDRFFSIAVPLSIPGFLTATALGFAHTVGEFGVALMIGGNIPGETRVMSIEIFNLVEALNYDQAHFYSAGLMIFSFLLLFLVSMINFNSSSKNPL